MREVSYVMELYLYFFPRLVQRCAALLRVCQREGGKEKKRTCINIGKPPAPSTIVSSIILIDRQEQSLEHRCRSSKIIGILPPFLFTWNISKELAMDSVGVYVSPCIEAHLEAHV